MSLYDSPGKSREWWIEYLQGAGAAVKNSTTKNTTFVIVGQDPGESKIAKARNYGVPTISWEMVNYLGLLHERDSYQLSIPVSITQEILISLSITAEFLYAKTIATGDRRFYAAFLRTAAGIESLLQNAWGDSRRNPNDPADES